MVNYTTSLNIVVSSFAPSSNVNAYPQSNANKVALKLANALKFKTISQDDPDIKTDYKPFTDFIQYLQQAFPVLHSHLNREIINKYSMLYRWDGSNPALKPFFINCHYDVVPVDMSGWSVDPFGGVIKDGYVWGRGSIDNKLIVISAMEAIETLLKRSYVPERTLYLAIGHDEEIGGYNGHKMISAHVQSLGITAEMILDEGIPLLQAGFLPGLNTTTALLGVNEKGYVYFNITATAPGGHSSMPPSQQSPIGILTKAVTAFESNPLPPPDSTLYPNQFLDQFTQQQIEMIPFLDYMRRTTTVTMFRSGIKPNVLPTTATAWISHRVVPGDDVDAIIERNNRLINDTRIKVIIDAKLPPSPYSSPAAKPFKAVKQCIKKIFGQDVNVKSGLMFANTDTRYYWPVSPNIYRIMPCVVNSQGLAMPHGYNEKLAITDLVKAVSFYQHI
ncbi:peptidase M20 family protein [Heterostelium album PN500]|uniref:Peptidase M20 family protein n=1 Tax=Heterostelium pallidum (strain ATCC 26659 / Pp 5 / PN500) TaxID=670386 RepID=D3B307_HETP5|nr:peptidase M20 family protein [Heterostelium album PN500]EFA83705.1 peptidase M20 family protein [Heterostelium album PN500]|eukprot:XP_020435822.1 peptidase M20 family protein [Heterostelium album PN500]